MTEWFREWIAKVAKDFVTCFITKDRWKYIVKGLGNTLQIALAAVLLGILIGTIVAIIRSTHDKTHETMRPGPGRTLLNIANWLCKVYLTVIRGTPAMIQILIMFFVVFSTARNGTPVAMLTFGINSGAYVAEIIRSQTYIQAMPLLIVAALYLIMVVFFSHLVSKLERRLRSSDH